MHMQENEHDFAPEQHAEEDLLDLNEVMQAFGVEQWQNLGPLEPELSNSVRLLVEIEGERYILRERPEGFMGESLDHRYDFQRYLLQNGIPIPMQRLAPSGLPWVTVGDDYFELQEWVDGQLFNTNDPHNLEWTGYAGAMLGRIHQVSSLYKGHQHRWPSEVHIGGMVQSYLTLVRGRADQSENNAISSALSNLADAYEAVLPQAMMTIGSVRNLPEFHIHGDYHALNLRFNMFGVTAVMGIEASHWEKRVFELAYGLFYFSALQWQPGERLTRPLVKRGLDPVRGRQFLRAYSEIFPVATEEAAVLAEALQLISLIAIVNGPLEDLFYEQEESGQIDDLLERLAWAASFPAWVQRVHRSLAEML